MTKKIAEYLQLIRAGLKDIPSGTVNQALEYYGEYIADALETGLSDDEVLKTLGSPENIIATIHAETLINNTEKKPGPLGLMRASGNALRDVVNSAAKASLVIGAVIPITIAILLYIISVVTFIGAIAVTAVLIYGIFQISGIYIAEKIGTAGMILIIATLLIVIGIGWWYSANYITRLTMKALRRLTKVRQGFEVANLPKDTPELARTFNKFNFMKRLPILAGVALGGIFLLFWSGLPLRYFSIWNSMKPANLTHLQQEFDPQIIRNISVTTLNSRIIIQKGNTEQVTVSYEQPDWMSGAIEVKNDTLVFQERSNGRLPFMNFVAIHEGMTTITIEIPQGYSGNDVFLKSTGGHISAAIFAREIRARTFNGNIRFESTNDIYTIKAAAPRGMVYLDNAPPVAKSLIDGKLKKRLAILESDNGKIYVDTMN